MPNQLHGCKFTLWVTTMLELNACSMIHMFLGIHFFLKKEKSMAIYDKQSFSTPTPAQMEHSDCINGIKY